MAYFYLDTSALVKRYHTEQGTEYMDILLDTYLKKENERLLTSVLTIGEVIATLNRKKNEKKIKEAEFIIILNSFLNEIKNINLFYLEKEDYFLCLKYILEHNINTSDALHLVIIKRINEFVKDLNERFVLVVSDKRLIRAARNEGLSIYNPEIDKSAKLMELIER